MEVSITLALVLEAAMTTAVVALPLLGCKSDSPGPTRGYTTVQQSRPGEVDAGYEDAMRKFIEDHAASFETVQAPIDLGTAVVLENDAFQALVSLPPSATPMLMAAAEKATPKVAAHLVAVVGRRGDSTIVSNLEALERRYQALEPKNEWVYAVIAQSRLAIGTLSAPRGGP